MDNLNAEYLKYAPDTVLTSVADLLNKTADTGDFPEELKLGILNPLPKPNKKKGPAENLRPIILLSVIRKILTICMLRRTWDRMKTKIPVDQAAYQQGRSTTEQVFAIKMLAEKAVISSDFKIYILLLDMSKAFDTVDRNKLFDSLEDILLPEELHLLHILTNNVKLRVRVGAECGTDFTTLLGIMQGDCLSAILFIYYLAQALAHRNPIESEHNYAQASDRNTNRSEHVLTEHSYAEASDLAPRNIIPENPVCTIEPKYADDITYASTSQRFIDNTEETIPAKLQDYNLGVNHTKTEKFTAPDSPETAAKDSWKTCKLLGSLLDTEKDITRRKTLAIATAKKYKNIYSSKNLSILQKTRHFKMFIESTLLYNCELWTMTKTLNDRIDAFQRRMLRYAIGIRYPKVINNEAIYEVTKCKKWSTTITQRRLSWFGHLMRLPAETPARIAFAEALKPARRRRGRPRTIWTNVIQNDLNTAKIKIELTATDAIPKLEKLCKERDDYKSLTRLKL